MQFLGINGSWGRFLGFWRVLSSAAYAFSNVENISVAAAETQNPRHNIPKAAKRVFWRILIFYLITIFMMGLIVPSNDKGLLSNSGDAGASPFAIAATNVGIKVVPSIINAVVVTSAWSAGNSGEYAFFHWLLYFCLPKYSHARGNQDTIWTCSRGACPRIIHSHQSLRGSLDIGCRSRIFSCLGVYDAIIRSFCCI